MTITFLGTGTSQGVPVIACPCPICQSADLRDKRLRTSALVSSNGTNILIDAGPDFRQQMISARVKTLDAILITHEHRDHVAGLDDVRAFNYLMQKPMNIWAESRVHEALKCHFSYVFEEEKYPGAPELVLNPIDGQPFDVQGVKIIPIRAFHYKLPVFGFRIGDFAYLTDANFISEEEKEKLVGSKFLVVGALRQQKHISHFSLPDALKLISELSPRKAFITHISHQMGLYQLVQKNLPENVMLAYDGYTIEV